MSNPSTSLGWSDPRTVPGELLWPKRFGPEEIVQLKRVLGPYGYASQYQMSPAPLGGGIFKRAWIREYTRGDANYIQIQDALFSEWAHLRFCTIDPATSEKEVSKNNKVNDPDYFTIAAWTVFFGTRGPDLVLLDMIHDRLAGPDHEKKIEEFHRHWKFSFIAVETIGYQLNLFQRLMRQGLPVREISNAEDAIYRIDKDKVARAYAATPLMADGRFYVPTYAPWLGEFLQELMTFPGAHDDFVDVTSAAVAIVQTMNSQNNIEQENRPHVARREVSEEDAPPDPMKGFRNPAPIDWGQMRGS